MKSNMLILLSASALALAACGQKTDTANADANAAADADLAIDNTTIGNTAVAAAPMSAQGFANTPGSQRPLRNRKFQAGRHGVPVQLDQVLRREDGDGAHRLDRQGQDHDLGPDPGGDSRRYAGGQPAAHPRRTQDQDRPGLRRRLCRRAVNAHQAALDALNGYATGGDTPALKDLAKAMIPTVTAHFNMAKGLK